MTTTIKTISKIGTLVLAAATYVFFGSNQSGVKIDTNLENVVTAQVDTTFQTLPYPAGPVNPQATGPRSEIEPLCPGSEQLCAVSIQPATPQRQIEWHGGMEKF